MPTSPVTQRSENLISEQQISLEKLDVEIELAERELRLAEVKKEIARTELEVVSLRETLRLQLSSEVLTHH
jgi:hypothetical protein